MAALGAPTMIAQSGPKTAIKISNHNLWAQVHYNKNSFSGKANTKIARDFEPALGEPRRARRASVSLLCRASCGWIGRQNSWKFNTGAFVWRNPNLFWTELMARFARQTERSGGQKGRGLGGRNFCPPSLSAAAEFCISLCEMRRLNKTNFSISN